MMSYRRFLALFFLLITFSLTSFAQKKEMSLAKGYIKSGQNLDKAEQLMATLLKDSANQQNFKIWEILFSAVKKQYDNVNEQMYLKQKADTANLFVSARKMFEIYESCDSVDAMPDKRGNVEPKYRKKHADLLSLYRKNLYNGGMFFVKKNNYSEAYSMFDAFIGCCEQPLFSNYDFVKTDSATIFKAAYMAMYSGYKMQDVDKTLKHAQWAMRDTASLNLKYQYLAETFLLKNDTTRYITTLERGFSQFPLSMYYFPRLFNHYFTACGNTEKAMQLCDKGLSVDSINMVFLFARSSVLLQEDRYQECVDICDKLIAQNDTLADAYLNAGLAYFNQGIKISNNNKLLRTQRSTLQKLYKSALPYLEKYRKLAPDNVSVWGLPLYTIYLNLNMGKQFEEMDRLLKQENGQK
ncbi:MAG: hypothetical protein SPE75_02955 [Prevotella sp.]|nr:hypothetical protein [Prevotella sp.]